MTGKREDEARRLPPQAEVKCIMGQPAVLNPLKGVRAVRWHRRKQRWGSRRSSCERQISAGKFQTSKTGNQGGLLLDETSKRS